MKAYDLGIVWIRRDIRLHDHAALAEATKLCEQVLPIFVFDSNILDGIHNRADSRVSFIYQSLVEIEENLLKNGSSLLVRYGDPSMVVPEIVSEFNVDAIFFNEDYTPYTMERDQNVSEALLADGVGVHTFKDSVVFAPQEILKDDGSPYKVFTPYKRRWLEKFGEQGNQVPLFKNRIGKFYKWKNRESIKKKNWYSVIDFKPVEPFYPAGTKAACMQLNLFKKKIQDYHQKRDFPAENGTSNLSTALRHGVLSVRDMVRAVQDKKSEGHKVWLNEIIWREFYQMITWHFPHIVHGSFKPQYDEIKWRGDDKLYKAWKDGRTGFPLVDAAMRCLKQTGTMHNRLRMVVASFLCKTLLVDWKKGERYFSRVLLDYDMASNNGGWQWCASTGCDAQPYFRIFNPWNQSKKFDPDGEFIRKYVPELRELDNRRIHNPEEEDRARLGYPDAIVDYTKKRKEALQMYKQAVG